MMRLRNTHSAAGPALAVSLVLLATAGCSHPPPATPPLTVEPHVHLVQPQTRTIAHTVGQPGFVYPYEQTALYPKVAGFLDEWYVDIGDTIEKNQVLAKLFVPELDAELVEKKAQAGLDEAQIDVAQQTVAVAAGYLKAAAAQVEEAQANVKKYEAAVERWESEVKRLTGIAKSGVLDQQVLAESQKQLKADIASMNAARATTAAAEATRLARQADLDKARADVKAAQARARVSAADEKRVAALVAYTKLRAPYDGIVVDRNANTGDYLQPATGDQSGISSAPGRMTANRLPVYVVARTDKVRVFVDVPEMDAPMVSRGTPARVRIPALGDEEIKAKVTRTSWSLTRQTRTLRAEIDLENPERRILPGTYAYARVLIERRKVMAIPLESVIEIGNQNCCYLYENGKAVLTPVQTGINDGKWVEVLHKRENGEWTGFTGTENVIIGDLAELTDGQPVEVVKDGGKP
jgi:HlyD family secretion protein